MKTVDGVVRCLAAIWLLTLLSACSGGSSSGSVTPEPSADYTVTTRVGAGGTINPTSRTVSDGATTTFKVTPASGSRLFATVSGCGGSLSGDTYTTGRVTGDCEVTATFAAIATTVHSIHTITTSAGAGGMINPASRTVSDGATSTFAVTPLAGYETAGVTGCNGSLAGNTYTIKAINGDCEVTATFTATVYTVTASSGAGGSIGPASQTASFGDTLSFTVTPGNGFSASSVEGCGGTLSGNTYTTGAIADHCTVIAAFTPLSYSVTASVSGDGGNIAPANRTVSHGQTTEFTVTPAAGYIIDTVSGCDGSLAGNTYTTGAITADCSITATFVQLFSVTTTVSNGSGGTISPATQAIIEGQVAEFTVDPDADFAIDSISGCNNTVSYNPGVGSYVIDPVVYTTGPVTAECEVTASFVELFTVTTSAVGNGTIDPDVTVHKNGTVELALTPDSGFEINAVSGCNGTRQGNTYTTDAIMGDCSVTATFKFSAPTPTLSFAPVKLLHFEWATNPVATHYRLLENVDGDSGFSQVGGDIAPGAGVTTSFDHQVPLHARVNAQYILQSCDNNDCYNSNTVTVSGTLVNSIGYFKASNTDGGDRFGYSVSLSGTGDTLAVGAHLEDSAATGIGGNQNNNSATDGGAVYVFTRSGNTWSQQAYIKASNTDPVDSFGWSVSLDDTGDTLAVGAPGEDARDLLQATNSVAQAGAVYVFGRSNGTWIQQDYIKAVNFDAADTFGQVVSLSGTGRTLAVSALGEDSDDSGIRHPGPSNYNNPYINLPTDPNNNAPEAGAVYVFLRTVRNTWHQEAYFKGSNTDAFYYFGRSISLDHSGDTLAVGADGEANNTGAVYVFTRNTVGANTWSQHKRIVTAGSNHFGNAVSLNGDGDILAVGADGEDNAGTVYVFARDDCSGNPWCQQGEAIRASNADSGDRFGRSISLNSAGDILAVGATHEDNAAIGVHDASSNTENNSDNVGAVYVFTRSGTTWSQQAYVKASNSDSNDQFGWSVSLDNTGETLAVTSSLESSNATGVNPPTTATTGQNNNSVSDAGAVYLY